MENEQLLSGMTALLEVKNQNSKQLEAVKSDLKSINEKLDDLTNQLNMNKSMPGAFNETALTEVAAELQRIRNQLVTLQNTRQEKRILLFPEHKATEYYSVILKWGLYIIIASYTCYLLRCLIDKMA